MRKGFSLIELIVVIGVTMMFSGFVVVYSRSGQNQVALFTEENKIAQYVFRAKSLAVSTYNDPSFPGQSCGYGLEIDYSSGVYSIFNYRPVPFVNCANINPIRQDFRSYLVSSTIPRGMNFQNQTQDSLYAVLFVPPAPNTVLSNNVNGDVSSGPVKIYLRSVDGAFSRAIGVNPAGQIDL